MENTNEKQTPDPRKHSTYDPRERIRNVAGTEPETPEDDEFQAKAQTALSQSTQNAGGRSNT